MSGSGRQVRIGNTLIGNDLPLVFIAGPCAVESFRHTITMAQALRAIMPPLRFVFKASFDKANRTEADAPRGAGLDEAVTAFAEIRSELGVPVITDVHTVEDVEAVAPHVDALQIPAMLCRQTDLVVAAGATGKPVHIKKSQAASAAEMLHAAHKAGWDNAILGERGTRFGHGDLVVDMREVVDLRHVAPTVFDATHSLQRRQGDGYADGMRRYLQPLARAAVAVGVAGLFFEAHDNPPAAISDKATQVPLPDVVELVAQAMEVDELVKGRWT